MQELNVSLTLLCNHTETDKATFNDFTKRIMQIREDFCHRLTEFSLSQDAENPNVRIETICPLCEKTIPQLIYKRVPLDSGQI